MAKLTASDRPPAMAIDGGTVSVVYVFRESGVRPPAVIGAWARRPRRLLRGLGLRPPHERRRRHVQPGGKNYCRRRCWRATTSATPWRSTGHRRDRGPTATAPVNSGSAYVFRATDDGATYDEVAKLTAADAAAGDQFGIYVAIAGDTVTIVVGARGDDEAESSWWDSSKAAKRRLPIDRRRRESKMQGSGSSPALSYRRARSMPSLTCSRVLFLYGAALVGGVLLLDADDDLVADSSI